MRVHVAEIISRRTGESRHGIQFQREDGYMVNLLIFYDTFVYCIPSPFSCVSQWRLTCFGRQEFSDFRKFQRQAGFVNHIGHSVFVVNRERLTPVTLARENSVTQTVVHFHTAQIVLFYIFLGCLYRFFDGQSVQ